MNADTASFNLTTANTLNGASGYNIIGAAGQVDGLAITGLIAPGLSGVYFVSTNGRWNLDNVLFGSRPFMSNNGWGFTLAGGSEVNFWATAPNSQVVSNGIASGGNRIQFATGPVYGSVYGGIISVTAVPEPASWAMLLSGFGLTGAIIRRRQSFSKSAGSLPTVVIRQHLG